MAVGPGGRVRTPSLVDRRDPGWAEGGRRPPQEPAGQGPRRPRRPTVRGDQRPPTGTLGAWIPGDFRFCLRCGVSYEAIRSAELAKLATLDKEGRSSAMTVLASSIVTSLRTFDATELDPEARKLLTFVDNRQDASLQAGHLNDFVQVAQLRGAIYRAALDADREFGLETVDFGSAIFRALGASPDEYAKAPEALDQRKPAQAMRGVLEYRALMDLRKGWRVTLPNLEQTGLIQVRYPIVPRLADLEAEWAEAHPRLRDAEPGQREEIIRVCLDEFRRALASRPMR